MQEDKMGWTCGKNRDNKNAYKMLFDKCDIQKVNGRLTVCVLPIEQEIIPTRNAID
jgi:hypothetical protein